MTKVTKWINHNDIPKVQLRSWMMPAETVTVEKHQQHKTFFDVNRRAFYFYPAPGITDVDFVTVLNQHFVCT